MFTPREGRSWYCYVTRCSNWAEESADSEREWEGWHYLAPRIGLAAGVPFSSELVSLLPHSRRRLRLTELRTRARERARFPICITCTGWSSWTLLRKLKYFLCCLIDIFLFVVWHFENSIKKTAISGVKSSWTSLYSAARVKWQNYAWRQSLETPIWHLWTVNQW